SRRADRGCRGTSSGRAGRYRSKIGAEWCKIALRSPPSWSTGFSPDQHTTVVCWGGGLNKYQGTGADRLQLRLRLRFRRRLTASIRRTIEAVLITTERAGDALHLWGPAGNRQIDTCPAPGACPAGCASADRHH